MPLKPEKYSLYDRSSRKQVDIPVNRVQESVNSGRYSFGDAQKIPIKMMNEQGEEKAFMVSPQIAKKYMRNGAEWLSPKGVQHYKDSLIYGDDIGDDILAGMTGMVDGLGMADWFSRGAGKVVPGLRERVLHNPIPHALGDLAVNIPIAMMATAGLSSPFAPAAAPVAAKSTARVGMATKALMKAFGAGKKGFDLSKQVLRPIAPYTLGYHTARQAERLAGGVAHFSKAQDHWNTAQKVAAVGAARMGAQAIESAFYGAGYAGAELDLKDVTETPWEAAEYIIGQASFSALVGVGAQLGFAVGIPATVGGLGWAARSVDRSWDWFAETNMARNLENVAADINIKAKGVQPMLGETVAAAKDRRRSEILLSIGIGKEARKNKQAAKDLTANLTELKENMVETMTEAYDLDLTVKAHEQSGHSEKALGKVFRGDLENINPLDTIEEARIVLKSVRKKIDEIRKAGQGTVSKPEEGFTRKGKPKEEFIESPDYDPTLKRWEARAAKIEQLIDTTLINTADSKLFPQGDVERVHKAIIESQVRDTTGNATRIEFVDINREFVAEKAPDIDTTKDVPYVFMVKHVDRDVPRGVPDEIDESRWMRGDPEETIYMDYKRATEAFNQEKKPWDNPSLKGVRPLREILYELQKAAIQGEGKLKTTLFPSPRDWIEFLVHHELAHIETPRKGFMNEAISEYLSAMFGYRHSHLTEEGQAKIIAPLDRFREEMANFQRNQDTLKDLGDELSQLKKGERVESGRNEKQVVDLIQHFENETASIRKSFDEKVRDLEGIFRAHVRDDVIGDERVHQIVQDTLEASGRSADDLTDQITGLGLYARRKIEITNEKLRANKENQAVAKAKQRAGEDGQEEILEKLEIEEKALITELKTIYDYKRIIGKGFPERSEVDYTKIPGAADDVRANELKIFKIEEQIQEIINRSLRGEPEAPKKAKPVDDDSFSVKEEAEPLSERKQNEKRVFDEVGEEAVGHELIDRATLEANPRIAYRMTQDGTYSLLFGKTDAEIKAGQYIEVKRAGSIVVDDLVPRLMLLGSRMFNELRADEAVPSHKMPTHEDLPKGDAEYREEGMGPFKKFFEDGPDDDLSPAKGVDEEERLNKDFENLKKLVNERESLLTASRDRILREDRRAGEARVNLDKLRSQRVELLKRLATAGDKKRIPHNDEASARAEISEINREISEEQISFGKLSKEIEKVEAEWNKEIEEIEKLNEGNKYFDSIETAIDPRVPDGSGETEGLRDYLRLIDNEISDKSVHGSDILMRIKKIASLDRSLRKNKLAPSKRDKKSSGEIGKPKKWEDIPGDEEIVYLESGSIGLSETSSRFKRLTKLRNQYLRMMGTLEAKDDGIHFLRNDFLPEKEDWLKELIRLSETDFYNAKKESYSVREIQEMNDEYRAVEAALMKAYQEVNPSFPKTIGGVFKEIGELEAERINIYKRAFEIRKPKVGAGDKIDNRFYEITQELDQIDHIEHILAEVGDTASSLEGHVDRGLERIRQGYIKKPVEEMLSSINRTILRNIDNKRNRIMGDPLTSMPAGTMSQTVKESFSKRREELLSEFYARFETEDVRMNIEEGKSLSGGALQRAENRDLNIANLLQKRKLLGEILVKETGRNDDPEIKTEKELKLSIEIKRTEHEIRSRTRKKFNKTELIDYKDRLIKRLETTYKELDAEKMTGTLPEHHSKITKLRRELITLSDNIADTELRIESFKEGSDLFFQAEFNNLETAIRLSRNDLDLAYSTERERVKELTKLNNKLDNLKATYQDLPSTTKESKLNSFKSQILDLKVKIWNNGQQKAGYREEIAHRKNQVDHYHVLLDELEYARRSVGDVGDAETLAIDEARRQFIKRRVIELRDYSHQMVKTHPKADVEVDPIAEFNKATKTERGETPLEADEILSRIDTDRATSELTGEPISAKSVLGTDASYENFLNKRALKNSAALDLFAPIDPRTELGRSIKDANRHPDRIYEALRGHNQNTVKNPVQFLSEMYSQLERLSSDIHLSARQKHVENNDQVLRGVVDLKNLLRKFMSSSEEFTPGLNNITEGTGRRTWGQMAKEKSRLDELLKEQHEAYIALESKFIGKDPEAPLEKKATIESISSWMEQINYINKDDEMKIVITYLDTTVDLLETMLGKTVSAGGKTRFEPGRYLNFEGLSKAQKLEKYNAVKRQLKTAIEFRDKFKKTLTGIKENTEPALRYWEDINKEYQASQDLDIRGDLLNLAGAGSLGFFFGGPVLAGAAMLGAGGARAVSGAGANPRKAGAKLNMLRAIIDRYKQGVDNTLDDYFDSYLDTVVSYEKKHPFTKQRKPYHYRKKVSGGGIWPKALTSNVVARIMHDDPEEHFAKKASEMAEYSDGQKFGRAEFANTRRIVKTLNENPDAMNIVLNKTFASTDEFAPEISEAMREGIKESFKRLASKLPEEIPTNSIFEESYPPSDYSIAQFGDFLALEEFGIYAALDFIEEGSFTPDHYAYLVRAKPHEVSRGQEKASEKLSSPEALASLPRKVRDGFNLFLSYQNRNHLIPVYQETYTGQKMEPQGGQGGGPPMNLPGGETMGGIVERNNIGVV